jgi:hypothetical protein
MLKIPHKILLLMNNVFGHQGALMEMYPDINVIFMSTNTTPFIQSMDQGVIISCSSFII